MPELVRWQREHGGAGLQVVGVTQPPASRAAVRRFVRHAKINYPILFGTRGTPTLFDAGETLPVTAVIDREGNLSALIEGIILPEEFEQKVKPLLRPPGQEPGRYHRTRACRVEHSTDSATGLTEHLYGPSEHFL